MKPKSETPKPQVVPVWPGDHDDPNRGKRGRGRPLGSKTLRICTPHYTGKYTKAQMRDVAREIARAGGATPTTQIVDRMRVDYESFDTLETSTVRHWMKWRWFQDEVRRLQRILDRAGDQGTLEAERARAKARALGKDELRAFCVEAIRRLHKAGLAGDLKAFSVEITYMDLLARLDGAQSGKKEFSPEDAE